jgi:polyisoprenoid-binding protein YceI
MRWAIDLTHSQITFAVKHLGISTVRGTFDAFSGTIDEQDGVISGADITIDVASLNTGTAQRDDHLRSADFFDVTNHPTANFRLLSAQRTGENLTAQGELTIRGVTKPVTLTGEIGGPAKDPWGNTKVSATLSTKLPRKEWGLTWNATLETGGLLVSEDVKLDIELQAAPAEVGAAA